ncbi:uncharacterized protein LTR77_004678 [Saxophila tyrrhenica]|uniref:Uncharacterized protein n=1 Tax=Saxophila tyrrhenica TaxID=1690608 RepID=A0AAV9PA39_9PEZI|nr:hypothetical protein LTR77_004678 [Saxophila tyrrhenica]
MAKARRFIMQLQATKGMRKRLTGVWPIGSTALSSQEPLFIMFFLTFSCVLTFGSLANGYTIFDTDCTLPNSTTNYVLGPSTRGTLDIIWSCFGVFIACIYSILHFKIPRRAEGRSAHEQWTQRIGSSAVFLSFMALIWPEWIYTLCAGEWLDARRQLRLLHRNVPATKTDWTLPHMFFANMGGFVLLHRQPVTKDDVKLAQAENETSVERSSAAGSISSHVSHSPATRTETPDPSDIAQEDIESQAVGGAGVTGETEITASVQVVRSIKLDAEKAPTETGIRPTEASPERGQNVLSSVGRASVLGSVTLSEGPPCEEKQDSDGTEAQGFGLPSQGALRFHLTAAVVRQAIGEGVLPPTGPPLHDIEDRSKSDTLAKSLVCVQLASFLLSVVSRLFKHLPIAPIEIEATAFAICSILIYPFLFRRPKNVRTPIVLGTYQTIPTRILQLKFQHQKAPAHENGEPLFVLIDGAEKDFPGCPPPDLSLPALRREDTIVVCLSFVALSFAFGAIHIAGWNLELPTKADRWLWRIAALVVTTGPTVSAGGLVLIDMAKVRHAPRFIKHLLLVFGLAGWAYTMGRFIFLVEIFRTLAYLSPSTYDTPNWTSSIPLVS